ncbi:hypothetical protein A2875_01485 [Candidatus Gottesmanbacteria bacterium RIFCSPHIGHO2_01_FULL_46_14]|uniref:HTH cro/C1-type domain-containing protein n=2 Tax=Candidatus Gottesmaniibacteriota TaxID=1752720 RepID=A0A1F5ZJC5_9BACT|nr:MAG: hypothetical protein A2875_01485 [Candidatus Gottesmanbacteria bacterium RIFCSPHIGHO2_01_FULL_46_14]OGG30225.1 MAG: hypothetical protein A2971_02970 [Candidatus Gottesmanbacteria bacterium RIFCSPLOWO2_01_FULL_46_21]
MKTLPKGYHRWEELEKKWMKNPEFIREWRKIEPEYKLARSLIGARLKKKMTQTQLARKMGTKQPVISRIEAMSSSPSVSLLKRVATALGAKLEISFSL